MKLNRVLEGIAYESIKGDKEIEIRGIEYDSRKVKPGYLFVCIDGIEDDGHKYLSSARKAGAAAVLVTKNHPDTFGVVIMTTDARKALAKCSANFYENPSEEMQVIALTGTKGKTTTAHMIRSILQESWECGMMGNLGVEFKDERITTSQNTLQSSDLQKYLRRMADSGVDKCVMEVTSMGLMQQRTAYVKFDIGIFTNISRAHIGRREHSDFDEYLKAKSMLFSMTERAVVNIDDKYGNFIIEKAKCPVTTVSIKGAGDVTAYDIDMGSTESSFIYSGLGRKIPIKLKMPGMFNVYNALCAATAVIMSGADDEIVRQGMENTVVPGRCERVPSNRDFGIMIDYAHSPDSLEKLLETMTEFKKGRVISVFGCGGDRDAKMRPMMGEISGKLADFTIITTDNPRFENPMDIMLQIEEGIKKTDGDYIMIEDRTEAIRCAVENAQPGDLVILAGKGHETYLDKMGQKTHYDEREIVARILDEQVITDED